MACFRLVKTILTWLVFVSAVEAASITPAPALSPIHYKISRRSGRFPAPDTANLTYLLEELKVMEARFNATTRDFNGNKIVRKPKRIRGTQASSILLGEVGREGNWFANLNIGDPAQAVDMDLDMLTADWWVLSTSSSKGSWFLDFNSKTYDSEAPIAFPTCREPTDIIHLPTVHRITAISFAHCRPAKQWIRALLPSGAYLGLAPAASLSQTRTVGLLQQLLSQDVIDTPVWSLLLINGKEGIFSIGGTSGASERRIEKETSEMRNPGEPDQSGRDTVKTEAADIPGKEWRWMNVQGAEGWWQLLMRGIWLDGIKVLENQPIILDVSEHLDFTSIPESYTQQVNTPFIVAPPLAARVFYSSISGSKQLPAPYDQFYAYPCFNRPKIHFEFEQGNVQVLKGKRDTGTYSLRGRFSLGRQAIGSGYCIGIVIESRMGVGTAFTGSEAGSVNAVGGNGLADVWIVGEPFFRDVQVAFNWKERKVGMQRV
ncbi:hypothetical protein MBM_03271 [Drepanopeziza brunnea f. sp. 'multigermtubi' MB_m1]|uniref:Peptidase A1 domain-containing protein n=1 Tax=Marssonina brunnea f. sp. multigermtubi (strain MB_m1) TaxID=1072389 RepID=K1XC06_MARBU|nr:uncharacterized protein MBM_03271 [Drepanopeziza brunnea f. sp. 'multigermtubi' MB_m1]EKD18278.1 hypothetical protein MBM_03271 [Drepanopeziza brunnea f. sp. 'multigermtubi' MB_m1]